MTGRARRGVIVAVVIALVVIATVLGVLIQQGVLPLLVHGESRPLRPEGEAPLPAEPHAPSALLIGLDGVPRDLLYASLRSGELPETASLLGGEDLSHAHLDDTVLSVLPSSTLAAWATIFTGVPPGEHGVAGNEYFVREQRRLAAPAPVSLTTLEPVIATYAADYANELLGVPTIYERLRAVDPTFSAWVCASQFHRGADRLLLAETDTVTDALAELMAPGDDDERALAAYAEVDSEIVETLITALDESPPPRLLTLYLPGPDHFAHGSVHGPRDALVRYLREVIDPLMGQLRRSLEAHHALAERSVVIVSDHGHTAVMHDEAHALSNHAEDDPPAVVTGAGFRLRPFELEVADDHDFDTVLAYGGAMAYAYVADRSSCPSPGTRCDWGLPPRYEEDVVPLAEAFFLANAEGRYAPSMRDTLDLILVREPQPVSADAAPFSVYLGGGRTEPLAEHLTAHPRASYVATASRLDDLATGPRGHRAGDLLLLARNGDEATEATRYYFAALYRSWHGSPSRADSEVPLVVAHPGRSRGELQTLVHRILGDEPRQADVARVIYALLGHEE